MTNHVLNLCRKISAESKILYSRTVNKKASEEVTEVSPYKAVLVTDYFDKAILSSEKTEELYILLLRALIYGNIPFSFAENPYFILFLKTLRSSYNPPSRYKLSNNVIQTEYARILVEMVDRINAMSDLTLPLDRWTDVSNNSIYTFLLHKFEDINEIINIEEFSSIRHTASNLLIAIINLLQNISIDFSKIIAVVTDNPSVMVRLRKDISEKYQHVIENNIKTGLQTFCETQWYSLSKVCLSVQNYENVFQTCLEYNTNFSNECPSLPTKIKEIITSRRHFFENKQFTTVLRYIVDAIAKLESNNATLDDIFAELLFIYKKLKSSEFEDFDHGLIDHAKNIVNFRAKEFDEPIYYLKFINLDIIEELITTSDKVKRNLDKNANTSNWTLNDILNTKASVDKARFICEIIFNVEVANR
ncbi:591_t:CDS:2, partial [Gigaspora rosea]